MANVAQLVRALVCGTRCREFESHLSPHTSFVKEVFLLISCYFYLNKAVSSKKIKKAKKVLANRKKIGYKGEIKERCTRSSIG